MIAIIIFSFIILAAVIVIVFQGYYELTHSLPESWSHEKIYSDTDHTRTSANLYENLRNFILDYLEDKAAPLSSLPELGSHLSSDLGLDSLDMVDAMRDIGYVANVELSSADFIGKYGNDPTVSQLVKFVYDRLTATIDEL